MDVERETGSGGMKTVIDHSIMDGIFDLQQTQNGRLVSPFSVDLDTPSKKQKSLIHWASKTMQPNHFSVSRGTAISDEAFRVRSLWVNFLPNCSLGQISPLLISLDQINMNPMLTISDTSI